MKMFTVFLRILHMFLRVAVKEVEKSQKKSAAPKVTVTFGAAFLMECLFL